jgi:hypothetical protein
MIKYINILETKILNVGEKGILSTWVLIVKCDSSLKGAGIPQRWLTFGQGKV